MPDNRRAAMRRPMAKARVNAVTARIPANRHLEGETRPLAEAGKCTPEKRVQ